LGSIIYPHAKKYILQGLFGLIIAVRPNLNKKPAL
jgi:hypothetical protein